MAFSTVEQCQRPTFRQPSPRMPKVYVKTYGCQMNERDSDQVAKMFSEGGYTVTHNENEADAVLINTLSLIHI